MGDESERERERNLYIRKLAFNAVNVRHWIINRRRQSPSIREGFMVNGTGWRQMQVGG